MSGFPNVLSHIYLVYFTFILIDLKCFNIPSLNIEYLNTALVNYHHDGISINNVLNDFYLIGNYFNYICYHDTCNSL